MGTVGLSRTVRGVESGLAEVMGRIGGIGRFISRGDMVLIKPNLNGAECCTDAALVEALVRMARDAGAREVSIGEATFGDARNTDALFRKTGYAELAQRRGIPLRNLNASPAVEVRVKNPLAAETLLIAREALEADLIINVPVMKVHYATGVTLALKNMKGVLVGGQKRRFHEIGLDKAIVDLNNTLRPGLNVIDAITCMERMGPRGGDIVKMDILIAGASAAETDCVGADIMGYEAREIRHLQYFLEANGMDPSEVVTAGEDPRVLRRPFRKVDVGGLVPAAFAVHQTDACSSCMNAFLLSCGFLDRGPEKRFDVFMGSAMPEAPGGGVSLAFGACAAKMPRGFDARIPGCPPYPYALKELLDGKGPGNA